MTEVNDIHAPHSPVHRTSHAISGENTRITDTSVASASLVAMNTKNNSGRPTNARNARYSRAMIRQSRALPDRYDLMDTTTHVTSAITNTNLATRQGSVR